MNVYRFWDMHSGGGLKHPPYSKIYIEAASMDEAYAIFWHRFGSNPDRVTCTCCGPDYSVGESPDIKQATGFHRGCDCLEVPRDPETRLFMNDDPVIKSNYWLDPGDEIPDGYSLSTSPLRSLRPKPWQSVDEYLDRDDVIFIRNSEVKDEEKTADIPEQGYVWHD